jgi:hypothetical protein
VFSVRYAMRPKKYLLKLRQNVLSKVRAEPEEIIEYRVYNTTQHNKVAAHS